jgi:hypothetical protein
LAGLMLGAVRPKLARGIFSGVPAKLSGSSVAPQSRARRFVGLASKSTRSQYRVAANNQGLHARLVCLLHKTNTKSGRRGGQVKRSLAWRLHRGRGFAAVHHKIIWFFGCSTKLRPKTWRDENDIRVRREASKRATRDMIEVLASGGRESPMDVRSSDGELNVLTKMPL